MLLFIIIIIIIIIINYYLVLWSKTSLPYTLKEDIHTSILKF